jgi:hypothetical protein
MPTPPPPIQQPVPVQSNVFPTKKSDNPIKRSIQGGLAMKPPSFDVREPSSATAATPPSGKKVIVKSADMLLEIQKEAVDTAISVNPFLFQLFFFFFFFPKKFNIFCWVCDSLLILFFFWVRHLRNTVWRKMLDWIGTVAIEAFGTNPFRMG